MTQAPLLRLGHRLRFEAEPPGAGLGYNAIAQTGEPAGEQYGSLGKEMDGRTRSE